MVFNTFTIRLVLPAAMGILLLLSLAYWWLDNLPHEIFGTLLFAGIGWHLVTNRFWFKNLFKGRYDARRTIVLVLHMALIVNMAVLLVTSLLISKSVFAFVRVSNSFYASDVHWFSAYWVMMTVGAHLGCHWHRVMAIARGLFIGGRPTILETLVLRACVVAIAAFGIWSLPILDLWTKLRLDYSLNFWDFKASVTPFFAHWASVVALPAVVAHYGLAMVRRRRRVPA